MLIAAGPGIAALQDYTIMCNYSDIEITATQGDTLDTLKALIYDTTNSATVTMEDDIVALLEDDANGWPTVNQLNNPQFGGTYTGGIASNWAQTGVTGGVTFSAGGSSPYTSTSQQISFFNMPYGMVGFLYQTIQLPLDQKLNPINKLPYYWSVWINTTTPLQQVGVTIRIDWLDATGHTFGASTASTTVDSNTGGWKRYSCSGIPPAGAYFANPLIRFTPLTTSSFGTMLVAAGQFEYATFAQVPVLPLGQTALAMGKYPTPYCDQNQPGCYTDRDLTGYYYRQLRIFGGYIRTATADFTNGPERIYEVDAVDYGTILSEAPATFIIYQSADNAAIAQACTYAHNQGYLQGLDWTTYVQNISTVDAMAFSWQTTRDVLSKIANYTVGAYYVDYYKYLHYAPALAVAAPFGVSDTPDLNTTFPFYNWKYDLDSTQSITSPVVEGSTQLSAPQTQAITTNGSTTSYTINSGNPVAQIDSASVGATSYVIGLYNTNTYAQGYTALLDPQNAVLYFNSAPAAGTLNVQYRINSPVLVRVHRPSAEALYGGTIRRKIHTHTKAQEIASQQAAVDRANSDLAQRQKARPIGHFYIMSPPSPMAPFIRPGMAIPITHQSSGLTATLFQVQQIVTHPYANGYYEREIDLGYYKPDFIIMMSNVARQTSQTGTQLQPDTVLQDVATAQDGWLISDSMGTAGVTFLGGTYDSTNWNSSAVWG